MGIDIDVQQFSTEVFFKRNICLSMHFMKMFYIFFWSEAALFYRNLIFRYLLANWLFLIKQFPQQTLLLNIYCLVVDSDHHD